TCHGQVTRECALTPGFVRVGRDRTAMSGRPLLFGEGDEGHPQHRQHEQGKGEPILVAPHCDGNLRRSTARRQELSGSGSTLSDEGWPAYVLVGEDWETAEIDRDFPGPAPTYLRCSAS